MERKDITLLATVGVISAVIAVIVSSLLFTGTKKEDTAPTVDVISSTMPDLRNDPSYNYIFNTNALDLAQPVDIGASQNTQPFNGASR